MSHRYGMSPCYWSPVRQALVRAGVFVLVGKTAFGRLEDVDQILRCRAPEESWEDAARAYRQRLRNTSEALVVHLLEALRAAHAELNAGDRRAAQSVIRRALRDADPDSLSANASADRAA